MKLTNNLILLLIIIIGVILRFLNYFEIPFTHDEFSALFRLNFSNFYELIEKAVKIDAHPAGVQVFLYYWTKIFGLSEWIVKIPFTIFGIFSIWLIYLIATKWFNETVGLISSAFMASIQFTIMYSQIARPYISGLFFSLLMVYYWTMLIKHSDRQFLKNILLFILSSTLCAYNHHFSLLFAAIVGFSGLFFIRKKYLIKYIIAGVSIFLLYLPHMNIFLTQLNVGGIGGVDEWLGKPKNDFIIRYIEYIFNFSILSMVMTLIIVIYGARKTRLKSLNIKNYILFLIWFILPFLIGFFYSIYNNPVLQFSVLIFSFPFLFFLLFGHFKLQKPIVNLILIIVIISVNIFTLFFERRHYDLFYNSIYEKILLDYDEVKHNSNNTLFIVDSDKKITDYYSKKLKIDADFITFDSFKTKIDFITFIKQNSASKNLYFGCLSSNEPSTIPIIQEYYPKMEWQRNYVGGTTFFFSKKESKNNIIRILNFENKNIHLWDNIDLSKITDTIKFAGKKSYFIDYTTEWGPTFSENLSNLSLSENDFIDISISVKYIDTIKGSAVLVATLDTDNKNIYWSGTDFNKYILSDESKNKWIIIHNSIKLSDIHLKYNNIKLKVFIWNKGKESLFINQLNIKSRTGNPIIYGLNEKI